MASRKPVYPVKRTGLRSQRVRLPGKEKEAAWDTVEEEEFERLGACPRTSTPHPGPPGPAPAPAPEAEMVALLRGFLTSQQRREEGFLEEIRGLTASILLAPQPAVHEVPQPPNLTSTTMTAASPRMALTTPTTRRRTAVSASTQLTSTPQGMSAPPVPAAHQESSRMPLPAERVCRKEPKMLAYQMGEDIENYLLRFECVARTWAWPEQEWACRLVPLLTGKALEQWMRRGSTPHHLGRVPRRPTIAWGLYRRWICLEQRSKEEIGETIILEQLLCVLPYETRTWVKEHEPDNGLVVAKLALQYLNARQGSQQ
ncbi:hypothetical protein SKAU_G00093950 [Synaphobranchus kaupii]|uniref:SCAN box domain-containing protein n=1 Tax=Synaphobranchus kaupii TaxID=118154 RepID=A0A9Q1FXS2_SYNKA|nr:hypothetical protein SKAU_G00093950 [Synaphobranchus kaupii]